LVDIYTVGLIGILNFLAFLNVFSSSEEDHKFDLQSSQTKLFFVINDINKGQYI